MAGRKISSNKQIDAALKLDGDPEKVRQFYEQWAADYDADTGDSGYSGPRIGVELLHHHMPETGSRILDAGCGTGQVGVELNALGYRNVDGFDLAQAMADVAIAIDAYREVKGGIDMLRADDHYPGEDYDAILSIGVFTLGHVPPRALKVLLRLLRAGGLLVLSTRSQYYERTNFRSLLEDLLARRQIKLLQTIKNAPYNTDGVGHYWVIQKQ